ncbi:hypothetical protein ATCC90586_000513 [Pythium insidiosum]|nr:hypothetical protein ATCC90586_000513 [Pythium insidiosum]
MLGVLRQLELQGDRALPPPSGTGQHALENAYAVVYHQKGDWIQAQRFYEVVLQADPANVIALIHSGQLWVDLKDYARAITFYQRAIAADASVAAQVAPRLALAYHLNNEFERAEEQFRSALETTDATPELHFDFAVTLERRGKILEASHHYNAALLLDGTNAKAWVNIAALHQKYGDVNASVPNYLRAIAIPSAEPSTRFMAMMNLAVAFEMLRDIRQALHWFDQAVNALRQVPFQDAVEREDAELTLAVHLNRARRTACLWDTMEAHHDELIDAVDSVLARGTGVTTALMPFDTLVMNASPSFRRRVAARHALQFETPVSPATRAAIVQSWPTIGRPPQLRVAYLSYDFADHPTMHLLEGVFATFDRERLDVLAFGYGRDDGSSYRRRLLTLVDEFVNIAASSTADSVAALRDRDVHIIMDAQGHTLGGRMQLVAARPAPIVVNYLVYPGTSGASFIDYVIADRFVAPPEATPSHFSERLVLLPRCYQVNYYAHENGAAWSRESLWKAEGPTAAARLFRFANFNKIDKLEPGVFALWMAILRRVPHSELVLLDPARQDEAQNSTTSDEIKRNLAREAASVGVAPQRLRFVPRVPKFDHLQRHRQVGLFLDTFVRQSPGF